MTACLIFSAPALLVAAMFAIADRFGLVTVEADQ